MYDSPRKTPGVPIMKYRMKTTQPRSMPGWEGRIEKFGYCLVLAFLTFIILMFFLPTYLLDRCKK
jgi:hypothetical protein